jgi:hypothetical protein
MPLYDYHNTETNEVWEEYHSYDAHKKLLEDHPHIHWLPSINIVSGHGDRVKVDGGMNDLLSRIARANPTSPLADRYGDKGIRATKSREAVKRQQKRHNISTSTG